MSADDGRAGVRIREGVPADAATLTRFNVAMARETEEKALDPDVVSAGVDALMENPDKGLYFVGERDGTVVGSLMITTEWSDWRNGDFWWIQSVFVEPAHRRTGVFHALYEHARALAERKPDVCGLRLYVDRENEAARNTYARVGMGETPYRLYEAEFDSGGGHS
ncbi:MAG: GNAT family N-acetyltransferase [Planctomycetota bacterium]